MMIGFHRRLPYEDACKHSLMKRGREQISVVYEKCGCTRHYWKRNREQWKCKRDVPAAFKHQTYRAA